MLPFLAKSLVVNKNQLKKHKFKAYEEYVAAIISEFKQFRKASISLNEQINGVRQPGKYEIDIIIRLLIGDFLSLNIIVECKHWKRKIDRPVVQKFIQTRDAISADKAIIVSPKGFTKEAIEVAKNNGVALWIITSEKIFIRRIACIAAITGYGYYYDYYKEIYSNLKNEVLQYLCGYASDNRCIIYFYDINIELGTGEYLTGANHLATNILNDLMNNKKWLENISPRIRQIISKTININADNAQIESIIESILCNDYYRFLQFCSKVVY